MDFIGNVAVTAIVYDENQKVLLTQRSKNKKKWPGFWTVPGGKITEEDFLGKPTEINNQWYNTVEVAVRREVKEETGYRIAMPNYLCSIAVPGTIILSFTAKLIDGEPKLQEDEVDAIAWIHENELNNYNLIDGIAAEIRDFYLRGY